MDLLRIYIYSIATRAVLKCAKWRIIISSINYGSKLHASDLFDTCLPFEISSCIK